MHRVPRSYPPTWNNPYGSNQDPGCSRLAMTNHGHRRAILPGFYWVLSILHTQLFENCETPPVVNPKRHTMGMGRRPEMCVRTLEDPDVPAPHASPAKLQQTIRCPHRCFSLWCGHHTLTRGRNTPKR